MPTPDAAMPWAQRLEDEAEAPRGVGSRGHPVARHKDPEAFGDWLKENDLPEETRQKILAAPQRRSRRNGASE